MILNFEMMLFLAPAILLAMLAQMLVSSTYARASQQPASISGFSAARKMLDLGGLYDVGIEQVPGHLSDHYDPRHKVLRLSNDVYHGRTLAAVGIACHEAGHALQDAQRYPFLVVRNAAVPAANLGSGLGGMLAMVGLFIGLQPLLLLGIVIFSGVVFFQVVNLPVEFDASFRAKRQLVELGIVSQDQMTWVNKVLNAAALTYVAGTLQSILMLTYYLIKYLGRRD